MFLLIAASCALIIMLAAIGDKKIEIPIDLSDEAESLSLSGAMSGTIS